MLSVIVNVKNGQQYLALCLNALSKFADVVLLDNYSEDNTLAIARAYPNVRIFQAEFTGMGSVRNLAASYAKYDWILVIDCDEVISCQLSDKLLKFDFEQGHIYKILRVNYYDNLLVNTSSWEDDWIPRIYNRKETHFIDRQVHDELIAERLISKQLSGGAIYHFPYDRVSKLVDKMQLYSTLYANERYTKKTVKLYTIPLRALAMFIKCYILKRGFLQGYTGFAISSYNAIGVFTKYLKLYELGYKRSLALVVYFNSTILSLDEIDKFIANINKQSLLPQQLVLLTSSKGLSDSIKEELVSHLKRCLIIPYALIIDDDHGDILSVIKPKLIKDIDAAVYLKHEEALIKLSNPNYFKLCKDAMLKNKALANADILWVYNA